MTPVAHVGLPELAYWSKDGRPHLSRFVDHPSEAATDLDPVALVSAL